MIRFDRAYAVACACCKADDADIPEVEAIIVLLLSLVRDAYSKALLAAVLSPSGRLTFSPLTQEAIRTVEQAARTLAQEAASQAGVLPPEDLDLRAAQAAERLQVLLTDLVERTNREVRIDRPGLFTPGSPVSPEVLRAELEAALDAEQALRPLVDAWAYQTFNAGSVRAAAADGQNFIQLVAVVDSRTTNFCRLVNGRVVPMALALAHLERVEEAVARGDAEAVISASPFHPRPNEATPAEVDAVLERGGMPPYHHNCRTVAVPIRLG